MWDRRSGYSYKFLIYVFSVYWRTGVFRPDVLTFIDDVVRDPRKEKGLLGVFSMYTSDLLCLNIGVPPCGF